MWLQTQNADGLEAIAAMMQISGFVIRNISSDEACCESILQSAIEVLTTSARLNYKKAMN
jgi:hypothetical protein